MDAILGPLFSPAAWPTFVCVSARLVGMMLIAPIWSMTAVPRATRAAIAVLLAAMLLPGAPRAVLPDEAALVPLVILSDLLVGLAIGLTAAVLFHGVALAGEVVSLQMGLSLGQALAPMIEIQTEGVGQVQGLFALTIYLSLGGHLMLLEGVAGSLVAIPPGTLGNFASGGALAASLGNGVFLTAARVGAPVIATLFLTNVALALLNRAVPQLNTMMVSFPLTVAVGLLIVGLALPVVGNASAEWTGRLGSLTASVIEALTPAPAPAPAPR